MQPLQQATMYANSTIASTIMSAQAVGVTILCSYAIRGISLVLHPQPLTKGDTNCIDTRPSRLQENKT